MWWEVIGGIWFFASLVTIFVGLTLLALVPPRRNGAKVRGYAASGKAHMGEKLRPTWAGGLAKGVPAQHHADKQKARTARPCGLFRVAGRD
jgi:hypothetical protein